MDIMEEYNALLKILTDPNASSAARESAIRKMQDLSLKIQQQAMSGSFGNAGKQPAPPAKKETVVTNDTRSSDIPTIAKKYYDLYSDALGGAVAVSFDGRSKDDAKAEEFCNAAALIAAFNGDGKTMVAAAAAAVGLSNGYARAAGTLASALQQADFLTGKYRMNDAEELVRYAISIDGGNIDFFITLALIRQDVGDADGAAEAIEKALIIDKRNIIALNVKARMLAAGGGRRGFTGADIGNDLVENDGELSKRATQQEKAAEGMEGPKEGDSKDASLKKLNEIYTLKPITPSDMIKKLFPKQAEELRKKIMAVSASDKELGLPEFPMKLVRDLDSFYLGGYQRYVDRWSGEYTSMMERNHSLSVSTGSRPAGLEFTTADYMRDYNKQVVRAAIDNYVHYCHKVWEGVLKTMAHLEDVRDKRYKIIEKEYMADLEAGMNRDAAALKFGRRCNELTKEGMNQLIPELYHWYSESRREGQRLWEEMLPYARCTDDPGYEVAHLQHYVIDHSAPAAVSAGLVAGFGMHYVPGLEAAAQEAEAAAAAEAAKAQGQGPDTLGGFSITASLGPFEFKLSANGVEVEAVAGLAIRAAFNPSKGQAEFGIGGGYKAKVGVAAAGTGVEAKAYMNFVFDIVNREVTDIYYSADVKGTFAGLSAGGQARISAFGKGASLSSTASGGFGVEHETTLISTESN